MSLGYAINTWHPFLDGNKRTALLGIYIMLLINDIDMAIPQYAVKYSVLVAKGQLSEEQFCAIVSKWCSKYSFIAFLKEIRYGWWTRFIRNFLRRLPHIIGHKRFLQTRLDWLAARDEAMLEKTMQEYAIFQKQGYPKPFDFTIEEKDIIEE